MKRGSKLLNNLIKKITEFKRLPIREDNDFKLVENSISKGMRKYNYLQSSLRSITDSHTNSISRVILHSSRGSEKNGPFRKSQRNRIVPRTHITLRGGCVTNMGPPVQLRVLVTGIRVKDARPYFLQLQVRTTPPPPDRPSWCLEKSSSERPT